MAATTYAKVNKELFFEWGARVQTYPFPAGLSVAESHARDVLDAARCKKETSLRDCLRFVTWLTFEHGSYGTKIFPAEATMAEEYGVSTRTVARWLQAATGLGIITKTREASKTHGITASYEIAPWWEQSEPPPSTPQNGVQTGTPFPFDPNEPPPF